MNRRSKQQLVERTLILADQYLKDFGFTETQVKPLLLKAEKDLHTTLNNVDMILQEEYIDDIALEQALHALKGLLSHLGNTALANQLVKELSPIEIEKLLFTFSDTANTRKG